jgi:hypothetical protein
VEQAELDVEELAAWSQEDDRHLALVREVVNAAITTLDEQKVDALARVLSAAILDEAKLDSSVLVAKTG